MPQVLYEYWVVATRPAAQNGLGLTVTDARVAVEEFTLTFPLLRDERGIFSFWLDLVTAHSVAGKLAHDARLVAAMNRHGLTHLMTFNSTDFTRFQPVVALTPGTLP